MVNLGHQPNNYIRDLYYQGVIRQIMEERGIDPDHRGYVVEADAGFTEVIQHTNWYLDRGDQEQYYRYRRYREVLELIPIGGCRLVHVDIGCGAGLFSWVLLDLAREKGITLDRVDLYGLDHSPEMLNLAQAVRGRLIHHIADYPALHYVHNVDDLLRELNGQHLADTDCIVTFGHVLVQANTPQNQQDFTLILVHIRGLLNAQCNCFAVAVDALNHPEEFAEGWQALLNGMGRAGIGHQLIPVPGTRINDNNRAKIARLYPIR